jgi:hypothetical protein
VRALFALGFVIAALSALGGGLVLTVGYSHPGVTQPMWRYGQYVMLLGLYHLFVYSCLFFQVRRLQSRAGGDDAA